MAKKIRTIENKSIKLQSKFRFVQYLESFKNIDSIEISETPFLHAKQTISTHDVRHSKLIWFQYILEARNFADGVRKIRILIEKKTANISNKEIPSFFKLNEEGRQVHRGDSNLFFLPGLCSFLSSTFSTFIH